MYCIQMVNTVLLSLFKKDNESCNIPHAAFPRVERYSAIQILLLTCENVLLFVFTPF